MKKLILTMTLLVSVDAFSEQKIDLCDRKNIGWAIARAVGSDDCHAVSKAKMSQITSLDLSYIFLGNVDSISDHAFRGLDSLENLKLYATKISRMKERSVARAFSIENIFRR